MRIEKRRKTPVVPLLGILSEGTVSLDKRNKYVSLAINYNYDIDPEVGNKDALETLSSLHHSQSRHPLLHSRPRAKSVAGGWAKASGTGAWRKSQGLT